MVLDYSHGRIVTNYDIDATGGGLWTSTQHYIATVPAGKRWFLLGGKINRGVSSTISIDAYDVGAIPMFFLDAQAAATGGSAWPSTQAAVTTLQNQGHPIVLSAGQYIDIYFGVAQNASSYCSCVVLEVSE